MSDARRQLLSLYLHALERVHGARVVREGLAGTTGDCQVVALGKAASAMVAGALSAPRLEVQGGFVAIPRGYQPFTAQPGWEVHYGGHPLPDRASLVAGAALTAWLRALPPGLPLVALVSGGSSACIEHLRDGISLDEAIDRTAALADGGADICALNAVRSEWSLLKQGRALQLAGERKVSVLVLADVPGDDPALVGSGPFYASHLGPHLRVVAGNGAALDAISDAAKNQRIAVRARSTLAGDAAKQGVAIAHQLRDAAPGLYLWGGESTIALPPSPGRGGRCQHLALAAALELEGDARVTLLAAGTDGIDGASQDAGAVVDGGTAARVRAEGIDARDALRRADTNRALAAAGDLVYTGPTGTNVMDVVIAMVA